MTRMLMVLAVAAVVALAGESQAGHHETVLNIEFSANSKTADGECNPLVRYRLASDAKRLDIQTTYAMDGQTYVRSLALLPDGDGTLTTRKPVSGIDASELACSATPVELVAVKCADPATFMLADCGYAVRIEGDDRFASFETAMTRVE